MTRRISVLLVVIAVAALNSCSRPPRYHYSVFVFPETPLGGYHRTPLRSGDGDPSSCGEFFNGIGLYIGPFTHIPASATVFGVLSVTDGKTSSVMPLYSWRDDKGATRYGCNGPKPRFALSLETQEALIDALVLVVEKKARRA